MVKKLHPDLPNDTELKLPENHPPKDANWLKSSLADRYPQAIDHLIDRFNLKKTYTMRGGQRHKRSRLTPNHQTSESGATNIFSTHTAKSVHNGSQNQERQRTNRSSIYLDNSGPNNSKLSEFPINAPTHDSSMSGRRAEAFRGSVIPSTKKRAETKKPRVILEDLKAVTVTEAKFSSRHELDTNMSYKAMMAGKRELDKHIATSEDKRRKTELGGFVTSVDHGENTRDLDQPGVSHSLLMTMRVESGTNKTAVSSLGTTTRTYGSTNTNQKPNLAHNQSFGDCNKLAERIRAEFFDNIVNGDYSANEISFGRKFFLAFDWMRKKSYLELDSFDHVTGQIFYNRRHMTQRELEAEKTAQALKMVERTLLRTAGTSAKVKNLLNASIEAQQSAHNRMAARVSFSVPLARRPTPQHYRESVQADKSDPDLEDDRIGLLQLPVCSCLHLVNQNKGTVTFSDDRKEVY